MQLREELVRMFPRLAELRSGGAAPAWIVGGAVRDLLRGAIPADVDVATTDAARAARRIGANPIRLGREEHIAAYRVVDGGHVYDVAELLDGDIGADLARRDFTIDAMAVSLSSGELLDPHGGRSDLAGRLVRMVDAANFDDDPLRLLKAVRIAVAFGYQIDSGTLDAIVARAPAVARVTAERLTYELSAILSANAFRFAVGLLRVTRLGMALGLDLPDSPATDAVPLAAALAIIVRDPRAFGRRMRWSEQLIRDVAALRQLRERHSRVALFHAGERVAGQLPAMLRALGDDASVDMPDFSTTPLLDGGAIESLTGIPPGPRLGAMKRELLDAQVRGEVRTREEAEKFVAQRSGA